MRLLNTETFRVEWFATERLAPEYAILSHRWEEQEVIFRDLLPDSDDANVHHLKRDGTKKGYFKIYKACEQAQSDQLAWLWVDTFCIDKGDSNELGEAINSMFRWYKRARVCYAFLCDVDQKEPSSFESSSWFRRGWTLQELLAPDDQTFYDGTWRNIGTKRTLAAAISSVCGIPSDVLRDFDRIKVQSIATRMSWASRRSTTRPEDEAYCLLGIFDINMDLRYGEQERAFVRLQEEILRRHGKRDDSMFAWSAPEDHSGGLLACSPASFRKCNKLQPCSSSYPIKISSRGIKTRFQLATSGLYTYVARLHCEAPYRHGSSICIFLRHIPGTSEYLRIAIDDKDRMDEIDVRLHLQFLPYREITVLHSIELEIATSLLSYHSIWPVEAAVDRSYGFDMESFLSNSIVDAGTLNEAVNAKWTGNSFVSHGRLEPGQFVGFVYLWPDCGLHDVCALAFGFDAGSNPMCLVANHVALQTSQRNKELQAWAYAVERNMNQDIWDHDALSSTHEPSNRADHEDKRKNLWILRGDRYSGMDVLLLDDGRAIASVNKCRTKGLRLTMNAHRGVGSGLHCWQVSLRKEIVLDRKREQLLLHEDYLFALRQPNGVANPPSVGDPMEI